MSALGPGCVKTICVARESRILSNEQMSRHSDFATDGKKQSRFALVRADLEFSHSLGRLLPVGGDIRLIVLVGEVIIDDRSCDAFGAAHPKRA